MLKLLTNIFNTYMYSYPQSVIRIYLKINYKLNITNKAKSL